MSACAHHYDKDGSPTTAGEMYRPCFCGPKWDFKRQSFRPACQVSWLNRGTGGIVVVVVEIISLLYTSRHLLCSHSVPSPEGVTTSLCNSTYHQFVIWITPSQVLLSYLLVSAMSKARRKSPRA